MFRGDQLVMRFGTTPSLRGGFVEAAARMTLEQGKFYRFEFVWALDVVEIVQKLAMHLGALSGDRARGAQVPAPEQEYILPGLPCVIVLFQCMQSALWMVDDREVGIMRVLLVTPLPRSFLLFAKILGASVLAIAQSCQLLDLAALSGFWMTPVGHAVRPAPRCSCRGWCTGPSGWSSPSGPARSRTLPG